MIIVKMIFGSHLYGTANETSDKDFKGVFMPTIEQILLGKIPKNILETTKNDNNLKNTAYDIDTEMYSLHYFINLSCEGQTVALDMLHAPDNMIIESSEIWERIVAERYRFYTRNLKALVGYARKQASKYGIKGSRLNDAKCVLDFCKNVEMSQKVKQVWDFLPEGEHIFKLPGKINGVRMYEVCGRKICETATVEYLFQTVEKFHTNYGERARMAANNENIDWKAVSHALRAAYQVKQILTQKTIIFPLKEADYLLQVKSGKLHYKEVAMKLESLIDEIETLSIISDLPLNTDKKYWNSWLISTMLDFYFPDSARTRLDSHLS